MHLKDFISEEGIIFTTTVSSKKSALEILSETITDQDTSLNKKKILDALLAREKLGSTGLGKGIAIPHCRLEELSNIHVAMLKLDEGIEFESTDDIPVTFLFCMIVPDNADNNHLQLVASLAELLNNKHVRQSIARCNDAKCIYQILCQNPNNLAA